MHDDAWPMHESGVAMPAKDRSHYAGSYQKRARLVRDRANADPLTRCWRCGLTLAEARRRWPDKDVIWHAGHVVDGDSTAPLLPEHSNCNIYAGAVAGNLAKNAKRGRWW
jgi:hypothetical protein